MRRSIARLRPLWDVMLLALLVWVVADVLTALAPGSVDLSPVGGLTGAGLVIGGIAGLVVLIGVAPRADLPLRELVPPVRGRWTSMNGPGQQLPSHGTHTRGQYAAVDLCSPADDATPRLVRWAWRGSRPQEYACFGTPVQAMAPGRVVRARDGQRDHRARNTWFGFVWMLTFEGLLREAAGTRWVLGNHVVVAHADGTFAAYAHLRHGSAVVAAGDTVEVGQVLGQIGNTGNTSMPHLHVQLMDRASVDEAAGVPMRWSHLGLTGQLDDRLGAFASEPAPTAVAGMPRNGEIFVVTDPGRLS